MKFIFVNLAALIILNLFAINKGSDINVSCKNENGDNVDWFYLYKLPLHYSSKQSPDHNGNGLHYMYMTDLSQDQWILSEQNINESASMPALTLEPLFSNPLVLLLAYNDEYPNGKVMPTGGHTKGLVATDGHTGIWLMHSVPKYPFIPKYEYPGTGTHYGQSFLCITLNATEMDKIGQQLLYNEPNIYFDRVPVTLSDRFPNLEKALNKEWIKQEPFNNVVDLLTLQGSKFKSFAKSGHYNKDLYADFVAPVLDTNLLVESWRNGGGNLNSNCSLNDNVYNVKEIDLESLEVDFPTSLDHSKWAVSQSVGLKFWRWRLPSTSNWICVGDINRQHHQLMRGGGVVCQKHKKVSKLYRKLVKQYESCEGSN